MTAQSFPCQLITWDEAYQLSRRLARQIKSSGFRPDLVVAIGRGGYVPARIVCDFLLHSLLTSIKVEHWDIAACKRPEAAVRFPLAVDIRGQSILIIDDITDTGDTLRATLDYLKELGGKEMKTGVLQHKVTSTVEPDFYADLIKEWRWIIYPWAAHEDLVGFAEKVLSESEEPASGEEIGARLKERYELAVDDSILREVLDDLVERDKSEKCQEMYRRI